MLSFHRLKYSDIPIGENKHRIEYLTLFRDLIYDIRPVFDTPLRVPLSPTTGQPLNKGQRFTEFNERKPLAQQMIALADTKTRREFATRVKGISSLLEVDVIQQFWDLETLGVSFRAPMDVVEEASADIRRTKRTPCVAREIPSFGLFASWSGSPDSPSGSSVRLFESTKRKPPRLNSDELSPSFFKRLYGFLDYFKLSQHCRL
jgi:hypothetical protein